MATDRELKFDFIVVGGGTAGLVVASRLSEDPNVTVAVVEAGTDHTDDPRVKVPGRWFTLIGSDVDWDFMSTEQPGLYGRSIGQPQGRILGGSSAINGQVFIPPSASVVDAWSSLGNPGWTWDVLAPYYRKAHSMLLPDDHKHRMHLGLDKLESSTHGRSGPLKVSFATPLSEPVAPVWNATFRELGYEATSDPASGVATGGFNSAATIDPETKERSCSTTAQWREAWGKRSNLHLFSETTALKLICRNTDSNLVAEGILAEESGGQVQLRARREVILAAGAIQSPKLLELSGIGNPQLLRDLEIDLLIANAGVGENMQDHLMTGISFEVNDDVETLDALRNKDSVATEAAAEAYTKEKAGALTLGGINYFSWMPIVEGSEKLPKRPPFAAELAAHPDALDAGGNKGLQLQYEFLKSVVQSHTEGSGGIYLSPRGTTYGVSPRAQDYGISSLPGKYVTLGLSLVQPFSRGSTHISSSDPHAKPTIDPKYLSNPLDVEVAASHLAFIEKLAATQPLASFLKPGGRRNAPEAQGTDREKAKKWVRKSALSNWHQCGTCSMMPQEYGGVVNERLLVHGMRNLRVVDSSVIPIIPKGNIQSSVYMVAERAADIIKEDQGLRM
ncbi:MAG: hypothetical protein M1820_006048 [Bogoriella megaspora]|nr:MAG: hypothetical protein M1820_006048 [Bogoriella megaspora]